MLACVCVCVCVCVSWGSVLGHYTSFLSSSSIHSTIHLTGVPAAPSYIRVSGGWCQVDGVGWMVSGGWRQVDGVGWVVSGGRSQVDGVR